MTIGFVALGGLLSYTAASGKLNPFQQATAALPEAAAPTAFRAWCWPGKIKPGSVLNQKVSHLDWLPTLAAIASDGEVTEKLRRLPVKKQGELPSIPVNARPAEVRAIKAG